MICRPLGRTGVEVGVVGLGCEHLVGLDRGQITAIVAAAVDRGASYLDIFMPQAEVRDDLGHALAGRRDRVLLAGHLGAVLQDGQYFRTRDRDRCAAFVDDFCRRLRTEVIDVLVLHYVDLPEDLDRVLAPGGLLDQARQLQQAGRCRFIGMSSHTADVSLRAVESGALDVLMFSVNPAHDMLPGNTALEAFFDGSGFESHPGAYRQRRDLYLACQRLGTAVVTMKTYGGGRLLRPDSVAGVPFTPVQLIHYALCQPAVAAALPGCRSVAEVEAAMAYLDASDAERDYSLALAGSRWDLRGQCVYCNHCLPCPKGIDVAAVTRLLDAYRARQGDTAALRQAYAGLKTRASRCIACEECLERCPFEVDVTGNMSAASELLG
ncbi:MAG: aldo/keto reductase [Gemmatimonadota bacterium]